MARHVHDDDPMGRCKSCSAGVTKAFMGTAAKEALAAAILVLSTEAFDKEARTMEVLYVDLYGDLP